MSDYDIQQVSGLHNRATGALVGFLGKDGKEYLLPVPAAFTAAGTMGTQSANAVAVTGGNINGTAIGQTTPAAVKTSNLAAVFTDSSGTPGNVTINTPRGRAAFAIAGTTVVVTNSLVSATSSIHLQMIGADVTLTNLLRVVPAAGSFTVTGNAGATAATSFDFLVIN